MNIFINIFMDGKFEPVNIFKNLMNTFSSRLRFFYDMKVIL
jgi:hypothetical protein